MDYQIIDAEFPSLQRRKPGTAGSGQEWSLENIRDGFNYFFKLNGKYPTTHEIDNFEYLPWSRSIQRTHGGLGEVRKKLGIGGSSDYRTGLERSLIAKEADERARFYEEEFYKYLCTKVPEIRVHEQKVIRPGGFYSDFFIYTSDNSGIVLDLFYAKDIYSLKGSVYIKQKKYVQVPYYTILILVGNSQITQKHINDFVEAKKIFLPKNINVTTEDYFKSNFERYIN